MKVLKWNIKWNRREMLFYAFGILVGYINMKYLHQDNYFIRLIIRIPQVLLFLWLYKTFVNKGEMKTALTRFRFQGSLHYIVMAIGLLLYITMMIFAYNMHIKTGGGAEKHIETIINTFTQHNFMELLVLCIIVIIYIFPVIYAITQLFFYLRLFTVYVYNHHRKFIILAIVIDDILVLAFVSISV